MGAVALGIQDKIRIGKIKALHFHSQLFLLPFDHAVGSIVQNNDHKIHFEAHSCFQFLGIHQKSAIPADGDNFSVRIHQSGSDGGRKPCPHGCQGIVQKQGVGQGRPEISCKPYLVDAVVQSDDAIFGHCFLYIRHNPLGQQWKRIVLRTGSQCFFNDFFHFQEIGKIPVRLAADGPGQ